MCNHHRCISRRHFLLAGAATGLLAACGQSSTSAGPLVPVEIDRSTACALDGMLLADYPGPKAQIHYEGMAQPDFFCDTVEMFSLYLNPEQVRKVRALYVQDMGKASWDAPAGHWIDARNAWYVHGSKRRGAMGPTIAPFSSQEDAQKFVAEFGGSVVRFADVKPDMVVLDGGALHDHRM
jgi:copper chaperone NosL